MNDLSKTCCPTTCEASLNATSSPESVFGRWPCDALAGMTVAQFGLDLAPANLSARQAREMGLLMSGICGPHFSTCSPQCRPPVIFGEQVASKTVEPWVDLVHADMEALGYAFGAVPFPSAGVGAPHIRDRLFWVADAYGGNTSIHARSRPGSGAEEGARTPSEFERCCSLHDPRSARPVNGKWENADWLFCRDGKWRAVEPGTFPLADGAASRVGRLRAYGNAINAEAATQFIGAFLDGLYIKE